MTISTYDKNEIIKGQIALQDNCHCTKRILTSQTSANAVSTLDGTKGELRSSINWVHKANGATKIVWMLPIGATVIKTIPAGAEFDVINACILEGFVDMASHYGEE